MKSVITSSDFRRDVPYALGMLWGPRELFGDRLFDGCLFTYLEKDTSVF